MIFFKKYHILSTFHAPVPGSISQLSFFQLTLQKACTLA